MGDLMDFAKDRVKSLVSKKVGAAVLAEGAAAGTDLQGVPLLVFIVVQGLVDAAKAYAEARYGE
jgi:hypothetical protein